MFKATFWWNFALIVFFLITVSLGVTLYVFYQMNAETVMHLQELSDELAVKNGELMVSQNELEEFKKKIDGEETTKDVKTLVDDHADVMKKYAENFSKSNQSYSSILAYLYNQMQVQNFTLDANQQDFLDMSAFNENRTKYNSVALDSVKKHAAIFAEDKNVYAKALAEIEADLNKQKADLDKLVKAAETSSDTTIKKINTDLAKTNEDIKVQMASNIKARQQLAKNYTRVAEKPNGSIQFISAAQRIIFRLLPFGNRHEKRKEKREHSGCSGYRLAHLGMYCNVRQSVRSNRSWRQNLLACFWRSSFCHCRFYRYGQQRHQRR